MKKVLSSMAMLALMTGSAYAKLPAPSPEAKAAADAAKDKAAWGDKVAAYKLCLSQDKTAAYYQKNKEGAKKPTVETPPCADPGPYVPPVAAAASAPAPAPAAGAAAATPASAPGAAPAATSAAAPASAATTAPATAAAPATSATPGATAKK